MLTASGPCTSAARPRCCRLLRRCTGLRTMTEAAAAAAATCSHMNQPKGGKDATEGWLSFFDKGDALWGVGDAFGSFWPSVGLRSAVSF